mgnify:CR=1 FL=1
MDFPDNEMDLISNLQLTKTIENEIEKERALTNNPDYKDKYEILEGALNNMNTLEKEYLELMEEQERLLK